LNALGSQYKIQRLRMRTDIVEPQNKDQICIPMEMRRREPLPLSSIQNCLCRLPCVRPSFHLVPGYNICLAVTRLKLLASQSSGRRYYCILCSRNESSSSWSQRLMQTSLNTSHLYKLPAESESRSNIADQYVLGPNDLWVLHDRY